MTWGEFQDCIDGYNQAIERDCKRIDVMNHILGKYISVAFNEPKRYPNKPLLSDSGAAKKLVSSTDDDRVTIARMKYKKG
jgi:hypothetical protein